MPRIKWADADEIAYLLCQACPDVDPMTVRFTELRQRVMALSDFADDPAGCNEKVLEHIQMAWVEQRREGS
jgi:FeS assembly protein IscX